MKNRIEWNGTGRKVWFPIRYFLAPLFASSSEIINKGRNYGWTVFSLSSLWEAKDFLNTARLAIMQIATMTAYAGATSPELLRTFLAT
jgi:hypothetical protein